MKRLIFLAAACLVLNISAHGLEPQDFFEFYSAFAQDREIVLLPEKLRVTLAPGESEKIALVTRPEGLAVRWISDDSAVCTVQDGFLQALREGECTVRVTSGDAEAAKIRVTVRAEKPCITISRDRLSLSAGESALLRATVTPPDPDAEIIWRVDDPHGCAAVSAGMSLCRVRGLDAGTVTVSAALPDGQSARAQVEITKPGSDRAFTLFITLMVICAAALLAIAVYLKGRADK